jgi:hypothetical protein
MEIYNTYQEPFLCEPETNARWFALLIVQSRSGIPVDAVHLLALRDELGYNRSELNDAYGRDMS